MNRLIAPVIQHINQVDLIFPNRIDLGNNVNLFWLKDIPDDTVKLDFIWNAGSIHQHKPLVASFCNQLLFSGNNTTTSKAIADNIDQYGGYLSHNFGKDLAGFSVFALVDTIGEVFSTIASSFQHGYFPEKEIAKWQEIKKKDYVLNEEKVSVNARKLFTKHLFGDQHPYGRLAVLEDYENIQRADIRNFYTEHYLSTKPSIFLVGNVDEAFITKLKSFAQLFTNQQSAVIPNNIIQSTGQFYKEKPKAIQSAIRIGRLIVNKKHDDYIALQVLNTILGGYFGSRLMANIREDKGFTYGIGSSIVALEEATYFAISTEVGIASRTAALTEIYNELKRLQTELVPNEELQVVKNYMLGSFLRNTDGAIAMMEKYKAIYLQDLNESYYTDYINGVHEMTAEKLLTVAKKYFNKNDFLEISYG
ncbi:MAG: pitrilysin family protein [Putridiphycobacter sp.]|nr:pitrilysin family protein [Putridiphycobacter sp.]